MLHIRAFLFVPAHVNEALKLCHLREDGDECVDGVVAHLLRLGAQAVKLSHSALALEDERFQTVLEVRDE